MYNSTIHHLCIALCAHHPRGSNTWWRKETRLGGAMPCVSVTGGTILGKSLSTFWFLFSQLWKLNVGLVPQSRGANILWFWVYILKNWNPLSHTCETKKQFTALKKRRELQHMRLHWRKTLPSWSETGHSSPCKAKREKHPKINKTKQK